MRFVLLQAENYFFKKKNKLYVLSLNFVSHLFSLFYDLDFEGRRSKSLLFQLKNTYYHIT